jgi:hypothetical protein
MALRQENWDGEFKENKNVRVTRVFLPFAVTEKVKFTLEQAMKVQRGSRGIALLFL